MNRLHISENMLRLRKEKRVTQEEVALFLGVSKAAVSKWETGQCMPDIVLLPEIATYFGVSVDELMGYEPQLSKEQIQQIYKELADDFATKDFEEVFVKSELLVKKYYSCYPFLFQICVLWMNHYNLAESVDRQQEILGKMRALCERILNNCKDMGICNDAMFMKTAIYLQMGSPDDAIEVMEDLLNPMRLANQSQSMLLQAYMMKQDMDKADGYAQISMYLQLFNLVSMAGGFLNIHADNPKLCDITIERVLKIIEIYELDRLNPNAVAVFHYTAAIIKCMQQYADAALMHLEQFVRLVVYMMNEEVLLKTDSYFARVDEWYEQIGIGTQPPRSKKLVIKSVKENLEHPAFVVLAKKDEFIRLKQKIEEVLVCG